MSTILVTGAAGFIGSHTCDTLLAQGHKVVGVDDYRTGHAENLSVADRNPAFRFIEADITGPRVLETIVAERKPDAVVHLAALVSVPESISDPVTNFRLNIEATHLVIEATRGAQVRRIVFASSAAVYGNNPELPLSERSETLPISPYGAAKLASEAMLLGAGAAYGITVRCMRYFNVFGPRQDPRSPYSGVISIFSDRLKAGHAPTIFGDGEQTRDFIFVRDVARANALAATAPDLRSGIANICTGKPTSLNQLLAALRTHFPHAPATTHGQPRVGDIRDSLGSPERARNELGFEAEVSLRDGLTELVRS